jgi:hypothetical protein
VRPYRLELTTYTGRCLSGGLVHSTHPMQSGWAQGGAGCHLGRQAAATALLLNFPFLLKGQVEPTNNRAERSLRPAVIRRKASCGSRARKGG